MNYPNKGLWTEIIISAEVTYRSTFKYNFRKFNNICNFYNPAIFSKIYITPYISVQKYQTLN
jgi:hypothetical protein